MSTFTLTISCLTTSVCLDSWTWHSRFLCCLQHRTLLLSPVTSTTGCCFALAHLFILSGVISPLISSSILSTYQPREFIFQCPIYLFAFPYCSWGSQGKNTEVVYHSLLQWTTFCQNSPPRPVCLGWPYMAWLSFIELDKAVVHVIRLVSFLWLWFQSVCPLMPSLSAYLSMWDFVCAL